MKNIFRIFSNLLKEKDAAVPPASPETKGMTPQEIESKFHIHGLQEMIDADQDRVLLSISRGEETESLRFRPVHWINFKDGTPVDFIPFRAFELAIDIKSAGMGPTLGLSFREVAEGRFNFFGTFGTSTSPHGPTLGNEAINAVADTIWRRARNLPEKSHEPS